MSAALLGARQPPHAPAALARAILAQPRFRVRVTAPKQLTLWDRLWRWIADRWNDLANAFAHRVHLGSGASAAIGDVLILLVIAFVVAVLVRLLLNMTREPAHAAVAGITALEHHADARALHAAAREAAQAGAYGPAIALLFRAALATLDARGILRDDPARTVNQCRSDVRARAARLSAPFDRIARVFTAAVYADDPITPAHWSQAAEAYQALIPQADAT